MSTIMVTGGSRGIGAATVRRFAAGGHKVFFLYEKEHEKAAAVAEATGATAIATAGTTGNNPRESKPIRVVICGIVISIVFIALHVTHVNTG